MRSAGVLLIAALSSVALATPSQLPFGRLDSESILTTPADVSTVYDGLAADASTFDDIVTLAEFPDHRLRIKSTSQLCDPSVKQYSGYLDISESKHLFFWFFESRHSPAKDPLTLWLNGGPGCSSTTGLLFELGPCRIIDKGEATTPNEFSWNSKSNMIFLDQPVQVGYSWTSGGSINNSPDAALDVYAFLQLFYSKFPEYSNEFHLAGESYGGTYLPNIASKVHHENKQIKSLATSRIHIPLTSVLIGNGLTDPYLQFASVPDYACKPSKYAIFNEATCTGLRSKAGTCQSLISYCYNNPSRFTCVPATLYCWSNMIGPIQQLPINQYDTRKKCDRNANPLCYEEMSWMETYLNKPEIKKALGAAEQVKFESCNMQINQAFQFTGDGMHNSAALLPEILESGIRLLIYAGEYDFMCNWLGNKDWFLALDSPFKKELASNKDKPFVLANGTVAGEFRTAGRGAGNATFLKVTGAGHMVPFDQPQTALTFFNKWIANEPFA